MSRCPEKVKALFACAKTLLKPIDTSAGIDELLLAGKVRMALGANFNTKLAFCVTLCGAGSNGLAASAADSYFFILGMNS